MDSETHRPTRPGWTLEVGDRAELEEAKLKRWRDMTPQQRLDAYMELLKDWWPDEPRLRGTARLVRRSERE
ncbi:MAG: hypothetical protein AMXMBFR81_25360 [Chthonomonas sp.]